MDTKEDLELMAAELACECRRVDVDLDDPRDCELHSGNRANEMPAVAGYMAALGWRRERDIANRVCFVKPRTNYSAVMHADSWELCEFTDSDHDGRAVGLWMTIEEGETVMELVAALRALPKPAYVAPRQPVRFASIGNGLYARLGRRAS